MTCGDAQQRLNEHLDGASLGERPLLDRHLADCPDCRGLHAAAARLEEGLRLFAAPSPPLDFAARVVGEVLADRRQRRQSRRRWAVGAALAASLLAGVIFASGRGARIQQYVVGPRLAPVVQPEEPGPMVEPIVAAPSPYDLVAQSGSAVASLPRRVADETKLSAWSLPNDVLPDLTFVGPEAPGLDQATASLAETRGGMSLAWESVEGPMRRATSWWVQMTPSIQKQ